MQISVITLFPSLYQSFTKTSLVERASTAGLANVNVVNLFDFANAKERVDSATYGHDAGMLLKPTIIQKAIETEEEKSGKAYKIFFSPHGVKLNQNVLKQIVSDSANKPIMMLPARYEGIDSRVEEYYADIILSVGDFVLMGGDLPAMMCIEGLLRLVPGVVGNNVSVDKDSFSGSLVDYPEYTAPEVWNGMKVPEILRSGDHKKIDKWREEIAIQRTVSNHFEWLKSHVDSKMKNKILEAMPSHYVVLMHDQVLLEEGREGTSSVTSIDIHDIARSSSTYGIKKYFIVTPLEDQQRIVNKLLSFWEGPVGIDYNPARHEAVGRVCLVASLDEAIEKIKQLEASEPILISTAAKRYTNLQSKLITYFDQSKVWAEKRPVLFIFGTARGLSQTVLSRTDYLLMPIEGFTNFNHLSVRSAVAVILDRWLGINYR